MKRDMDRKLKKSNNYELLKPSRKYVEPHFISFTYIISKTHVNTQRTSFMLYDIIHIITRVFDRFPYFSSSDSSSPYYSSSTIRLHYYLSPLLSVSNTFRLQTIRLLTIRLHYFSSPQNSSPLLFGSIIILLYIV